MSFAEVKEQLKGFTREELDEMALHLEFLRRTSDPEWRKQVARADHGPWTTDEKLRELDARLTAEGR